MSGWYPCCGGKCHSYPDYDYSWWANNGTPPFNDFQGEFQLTLPALPGATTLTQYPNYCGDCAKFAGTYALTFSSNCCYDSSGGQWLYWGQSYKTIRNNQWQYFFPNGGWCHANAIFMTIYPRWANPFPSGNFSTNRPNQLAISVNLVSYENQPCSYNASGGVNASFISAYGNGTVNAGMIAWGTVIPWKSVGTIANLSLPCSTWNATYFVPNMWGNSCMNYSNVGSIGPATLSAGSND